MSTADLPVVMEPVRAYLDRANELQRPQPLVSHLLRLFAMNVSMQLRSRMRSADLPYLLRLMDDLERERKVLAAQLAAADGGGRAALRRMAIDLYERAKGSDRPDISNPHPSMKWTVVEAPKVAQCFHASAVLFDALRQFPELRQLPQELLACQQAAHARSQQLSHQLSRALGCPPSVPVEWRPLPPSMLPPLAPAPAPASAKPAAAAPAPAPATAPAAGLAALPSVPGQKPPAGPPPAGPPPPGYPAPAPPLAAPPPAAPPPAYPAATPAHPPPAAPPPAAPPPAAPPPGYATVTPPPAAAAAATGSAPSGSAFAPGQEVWYKDGLGTQQPAKIDSVHFDDGVPYFSVALPGGAVRDTEAGRLAPRNSAAPPPLQPPQPPPAAPQPAATLPPLAPAAGVAPTVPAGWPAPAPALFGGAPPPAGSSPPPVAPPAAPPVAPIAPPAFQPLTSDSAPAPAGGSPLLASLRANRTASPAVSAPPAVPPAVPPPAGPPPLLQPPPAAPPVAGAPPPADGDALAERMAALQARQ